MSAATKSGRTRPKATKPAARRRQPLEMAHVNGQLCAAHPVGFNDRLRDTFGTLSLNFAQSCLASLMAAQPVMSPEVLVCKTNAALAAVVAVRPCDELEAALAVQMAATHDLAMEAVANARRQGSDPETQAAVRLAIDLLQACAQRVDALATLRREWRRGR